MNNYVRLLACGLACGPAVAGATAPQQPDSAQRQEQQKGRLWTAAVRQGWPALARQPQWPTKDSLDAWLKKAKDVGVFSERVVKYTKTTYGHPKALPAELVKALEVQLPAFLRERNRSFTNAQQQALHQQLQTALVTTIPASGQSITDTMTQVEQTSAGKTPPPKSVLKDEHKSASYLLGLAGVALGFAAGWLANQRRNLTAPSPPATLPPAAVAEANMEKPPHDQEFMAAAYRKPDNKLKSQRTTAEPPTAAPKTTPPQSPPQPMTPASELAEDQLEGALPTGVAIPLSVSPPQEVAPLATIQLFGPSPDMPAIEARKFSALPLPQMPICLKLASADATMGSFELNLYAEQSRLIGNGIRELRTFFDFDLPLPESFTTLTTSKFGTLVLRDGTWHLETKAKIELT